MARLSMDDPLFATYIFYASVLALKTLFMTFWTAKHRISKKIFPSPEDYHEKKQPMKFSDEDIDRVKRAHQNDLENILPFLAMSLLFVMTDPNVVVATWIFRVFTAGRILHTIAYLNAIHNLRGVGFISSTAANLAMTIMLICKSFGNF